MNIGGYKIYSITTSQFALDGGAMFGIIPKTLWEKHAPADESNRIAMVTRSMLLVGHGRIIIIDTGNGDKWTEKYRSIYKINTDIFNLETELKKFGFSSMDITDVLCTHLHFDHIGGNTKFVNGKSEPVFPHAVYWMQKENFTLANSPGEKDQGSFRPSDWSVLSENNMIRFVDGKEKFLPNIDILLTYGHTNGMMHPIIRDNLKSIIYGADLFPLAAHIPVPWVMAYDNLPALSVKEKKKLLPELVKNETIVFFEHDPRFQAGTIGFDGRNYNLKNSVKINE